MPFVEEVLKYNSLSIVGLEKNTGKTECLNYLIKHLPVGEITVAISSVGIDGERIDQVTHTHKPEIYLKKGIVFTTSEKHYRERRFLCELLDVDDERTALGRLITAKALVNGKIILSGPSTTAMLEKWVNKLRQKFGAQLCIVDGALSRLSLASPAVAQSMILTTGAALSIDIPTLARKTAFTVELINLPVTRLTAIGTLENKEQGIWTIDNKGKLNKHPHTSAFSPDLSILNTNKDIIGIYLSGALTNRFLKKFTDSSNTVSIEIIVNDFTRFFIDSSTYRKFTAKGGCLSVLKKTKLIAICANPVAPNGVILDSDKLCSELAKAISMPIYDIFKDGYKV